jgi:hypothetical protein
MNTLKNNDGESFTQEEAIEYIKCFENLDFFLKKLQATTRGKLYIKKIRQI